MHSNKYIFLYSSAIVIVVAVALTVVAVQLKPLQENNVRIEKMQNILSSVNIMSTTLDAEVLYKKYITQELVTNSKGENIEGQKAFVISLESENRKAIEKRVLPIYVCSQDNGEKNYIIPVRGKGLWGPIWGYIAFKPDFNTIVGVMFDHKSETPGLGAEINTETFQKQFFGKLIFDEKNNFVSVKTVKGGTPDDNPHGVDAISGGTITSDFLSETIYDGLKIYQEFIKKNKTTN